MFFSYSKRHRISDALGKRGAGSAASASTGDHLERRRSSDCDLTLTADTSRHDHQQKNSDDTSSRNHPPSNASVSSTTFFVRSKPRLPERKDDPLGLTLIYTPDGEPSADIIFIHGLGGSSRLTWSNNHDLNLFWPLEWLPCDQDVSRARIFTFGYNADFRSTSQSAVLGITDFAKNLLFDMLYGRSQSGQNLCLGQFPLIFVTHSMGGLVFKKAYIDAQLDSRYQSITRSIKAVIFLSTPHRGADLSELLNKLLSASFRISPKQYVAELSKHGPFLRTVNEQFRHLAAQLQIFSFYESLQTSIGLISTMILDEDSAKLGYPGEISRSLNADHHGVCKFVSPEDTNYRAVLGALKTLVSSHLHDNTQSAVDELSIVRTFLTVSDNMEHDFEHFWSRRAEDTCEWFLDRPEVQSWSSSRPYSELLLLHGRPARGKSVLSAFVIHELREKSAAVQHFFFRNGDETKRSISSLLRSLAFQIAAQVPAYRKALVRLAEGGYKPKEADWKSTWKRLFLSLLFKMDFCPPFYWVIDGLDECSFGKQALELLGDINDSKTPIHVLVTSRFSPGLSVSFRRIATKSRSTLISIDQEIADIRTYVEEEFQYLSWDQAVKSEAINKILDQAHNNFLWVHLILEEIKECHTDDDVRTALEELPPGMDSLYKRMVDSISRIRRPSDRNLSQQLLLWAIHARRCVSTDELSAILEPDFGRILDMESTINKLCGQFLVIEGQNQIGLLHQTAREYLTTTTDLPFSLDDSNAHGELFQKSISALIDPTLRSKLQVAGAQFLRYRATCWFHHLRIPGYSDDFDDQLDLLMKLFKRHHVLVWIQVLALLGQFQVLLETSQRLSAFIKRKRNADAARQPSLRRLEDLELLDLWSRDLLKLPGRFGSILSQDPDAIHTCIVPFCPQGSAMYKTVGRESSPLKVNGLPEDWDDCLARVSVGSEHQATLMSCSWRYLAIVNDAGTISVWNCTTFHQTHTMNHAELVSAICFSGNGNRIATYGRRTTKVWDCQTGHLLNTFANPPEMQGLCLEFAENSTSLMAGTDRQCVLQVSLEGTNNWSIFDPMLLRDVESFEGTILSTPTVLAISPDHTRIAVVYRRFPLTIWSLAPAKVLRRVSRNSKYNGTSTSPFVAQISWHPNSEELIGLFQDGYSFKLNVLDGKYQEHPPDPGQWPFDIHVSPDGTVFAILGVQGSIKLYDYRTYKLIYQLTSEDVITGFCFSQDGRRFFDIRGSSCNIWEPNALVRLSAGDDNPASSQAPDESVEQSNYPSESFVDNHVAVVLVSIMPRRTVVALGDDDGLVALMDYGTAEKYQVDRTATGMAIEHLVWSEDGCHFVYGEVGGRLTIVCVESTPTGWKHHRVTRFRPKKEPGGISQVLLSPDSSIVLVASQQSVQLWSVKPGCHKATYTINLSSTSKWALHPSSPEHVIAITSTGYTVKSWSDMSEVSAWSFPSKELTPKSLVNSEPPRQDQRSDDKSSSPPCVTESVEKILVTHCKGIILVNISRRSASTKLKPRVVLFDGMTDPRTSSKEAITIPIPTEVMSRIEVPLNVLRNERLVFLDQSFGVYTWHLRSSGGSAGIKRHFFIPRDWISDDNIALLQVTSSGSILCPRKGGITVIDSTIGSEW
ncbi:hypothetical protein F4779DRAFT_449667 [Xylariaceae sp. FL0662B]|nr:hypothetical protein F4779DRAFT_449667 [Xylariaceae sp. FL0662B]